ncbi:MAG: metalloregulator ArsR/SmtB family transcription factor [Proteobacteria bacterium]|nr:metalloregulator ArsR/SmtB family transcription factor [Pseudomonadota bacterium]
MKNLNDFEEYAEILKVIGHPVRLTILTGLMERKSCVKDIWDCLGLPQATVSQHLSVLKNKGIIKSKKIGVKREYSVEDPFVKEILQILIKESK